MSQLQQFTAIVIKAVFVKFEKFHIGEEEKTLEKKVKLYAEVELSAQGYDRHTHTHTHRSLLSEGGGTFSTSGLTTVDHAASFCVQRKPHWAVCTHTYNK